MTTNINPKLEARARSWARARMSPERFDHTIGVVETVTHLAARHDLGSMAALRLAGWIHDAAKELGDGELIAWAERLGYPIRPIERQAPLLLHGAVAALLARQELGLDDPLIFTAATYHTSGHPDMSRADKAFYLADLIEPSRTLGWIEQTRQLAEEDLDKALLFALTRQLRRLLKRGAIIDPRSVELHNRLLLSGVELVARE